MNGRCALAALLAVAVTAATRAGELQTTELYPMKPGTKWTYVVKGQDERFIFAAVKLDAVGETPCVRFEGRVKNEIQATEHLTVTADGVYRVRFNEKMIGPPVCILKLPAKPGLKWEQEIKVDDKTAAARFETDVEKKVEVPAGTFTDVIVVKGDVTERGSTVKTTLWFAPKVGIIKQQHDFGKDDKGNDAKVILELEKVELPEAKK